MQRVAFIICACKTRLGPPVTVPFSALGTLQTPPPPQGYHPPRHSLYQTANRTTTDCVSIGLIGLATLASIASFAFSGRMSACCNIVLALVAFLVVAVASALATAIAVIGARAVDRYAEQVGVTADPGRRFLGLTWGATAAMLVCLVWWSVDCCVGRRGRRKRFSRGEKYSSWDK